MKQLTLVFIFIAYFLLSASDEGIEEYIKNETANLNKLQRKAKVVPGTLYFQDDSLVTNLLLFRRKDEVNHYLFCVAKSKNDSIQIYTAKEILGYKIGNKKYARCFAADSYFFIHLIHSGNAELYDRKGIPGDKNFLYFLRLPVYSKYFVINPVEKRINEHRFPSFDQGFSRNAGISYLSSVRNNQKFKRFVVSYLGDCKDVCNMVNSDEYTIYDLPTIIESYNNCTVANENSR